MSRAANRVALVTGASRGIGAATARRLARDGFAVAIGYGTGRAEAEAVAAEIEGEGGAALTVGGDLARPDVPARLVGETVERFGRLDALVNNAATLRAAKVDALSAEGLDAEYAVNLRAPLLLVREALPHLEGAGGAVVNVSSLNGSRMPSRGAPGYSATKAALDVATRSLAAELGSRGIRVNAVAPGATRTEMFLSNSNEEIRDFFTARTALGRLGEPDEVAAVIAFLLSRDAGWVTGQIVSASGGFE